jgi:hypothetical protein
MSTLKLRHSPYAIFKDSQTPPGLYARQKWLNQGETEIYRANFAATVAKLKSADMDTVSREERILVKLHRLFGLHLTVRNADRSIETALNEVIGENRVADVSGRSCFAQQRYSVISHTATYSRVEMPFSNT